MGNRLQPKAFLERPLWTGVAPFAVPADAENKEHFCDDKDNVARLTDVSVPTLSFYPATAVAGNARPAVIVCPGGGYGILAWNHEGLDIVSWLNYHGISAFLLKYRCPDRKEAALADAARAVRLVRSQAEALNILPDKIGIIGFSAGAHLSVRVSNLAEGIEPYPPADAIDALPCHPDFQMIIYPAYIDRPDYGTDPDLAISEGTPPAFIMQAEDDFFASSSLCYYLALKKAGVQAELHVFSRGGHGYGLLRNGQPTEAWPELAYNWICTDIMKSRSW